jgi:hypothetical protein
MKITGLVSRTTVLRHADKYKLFGEQCRELAKPLSGQLKQTLEEMANVWDDLASQEDKRSAGEHEKARPGKKHGPV